MTAYRQSYDLDADALYISVQEADIARTVEIDSGTMVDLDASGSLVGIEVIHPDRAWPIEEIIGRFATAAPVAAELRAYFPQPGASDQGTSPVPERTWPVFGGKIKTALA